MTSSKRQSVPSEIVLLGTTLTRTIILHRLMIWLLDSNHLPIYQNCHAQLYWSVMDCKLLSRKSLKKTTDLSLKFCFLQNPIYRNILTEKPVNRQQSYTLSRRHANLVAHFRGGGGGCLLELRKVAYTKPCDKRPLVNWRTGVDSLPFCFPRAESASGKVPMQIYCKIVIRRRSVNRDGNCDLRHVQSYRKNSNTEVFKTWTLCPYFNTVVIFSLTTHTSSTESSN